MSDKKELLTIAVIAAALMMVLGTSIPSNVLASTSIEAAEPSDESGNDDTSNSGGGGSDENTADSSDDKSSNDNSDSGSNDDSGNDENSDNSSDDSSDSSSGGVPEEYLGEYSTCVTDLSTDDSMLSQDDVVDCYGQVFGPNPTHELGPLTQNSPNTPATTMPGFENMPSALQQPGDQQPGDQQQMQPLGQTQPQDGQQQPIQQQQSYPAVGDQQQAQPLGQTQPQDGQQAQPLGQTQPQDGQQQPIQQQQQPYPGMGGQQQMSPTELPIDAGILDVDTIKEIVKNRLAQ
jgi:hypothetical protein